MGNIWGGMAVSGTGLSISGLQLSGFASALMCPQDCVTSCLNAYPEYVRFVLRRVSISSNVG
jgi:hypothetical protein